MLISIIGIVVFIVLIFLGLPIAFSFAIVGFVGIIVLKGVATGLHLLGSAPWDFGVQWGLVSVPLFILMGQLAFHSGISSDLYTSAHKWIGRFPGGLALATLLACTGFAACTGSSIASAATMGSIALPEMKRLNYNPKLACAVVAAGGTLGILIPPSIIFIIYGTLTATSIGKLFIAGILPGLLLSGMFLILIFVMCKRDPELGPAGPSFPWKEMFISLKGIWGMLALFILVIGGLYMGLFAPSEAGAVGAFGAFLIALSRGRLKKGILIGALIDSFRTTCFALTILIGAMIFSVFLTLSGLPAVLTNWITGLNLPPILVLILILLLYVPLGMVMDCMPMILLTLPIVFPVIVSLGFDPIWFGVLLVVMGEMGLLTPPVGMNVFVVQGVSGGVPLYEIFRGIVPFVFVMAACVAILVAFPQISLFLPGLMK